MCNAPALGMKQGNSMQLNSFAAGIEIQSSTQGMKIDVAMGEHHALGIGAGPACVKQFSQGIFVELHDVGVVRSGAGKKIFVVQWRSPGCCRVRVQKKERPNGMKLFAK